MGSNRVQLIFLSQHTVIELDSLSTGENFREFLKVLIKTPRNSSEETLSRGSRILNISYVKVSKFRNVIPMTEPISSRTESRSVWNDLLKYHKEFFSSSFSSLDFLLRHRGKHLTNFLERRSPCRFVTGYRAGCQIRVSSDFLCCCCPLLSSVRNEGNRKKNSYHVVFLHISRFFFCYSENLCGRRKKIERWTT